MTTSETPSGPDLVGGRISLDFINSEGGRRNGPPEWIGDYDALLAWSKHAGLLDEAARRELVALAKERPEAAGAVAGRAVELREALYRAFVAAMDDGTPDPDDLGRIDRELRTAMSHLRLEPGAGSWRVDFAADRELDRSLWPIVRDAANLLSSDDLPRVKKCSGRDCSWLFLDESRNRSRRWCDMAVCGNRAKARRHYARTKDD